MACGCNKGKAFRTRTPAMIPMTSQRAQSGGVAAGLTPTQLRAQAMAPQQERSPSGLVAEKRKVQAIRRDAIRKALGK
jgi:hypothetical protein